MERSLTNTPNAPWLERRGGGGREKDAPLSGGTFQTQTDRPAKNKGQERGRKNGGRGERTWFFFSDLYRLVLPAQLVQRGLGVVQLPTQLHCGRARSLQLSLSLNDDKKKVGERRH